MIKFLDLKAVNDRYADDIGQAVDSVLRSGWYLQGDAVRTFEDSYARFIGTRHCVGVANGLDALTLIYRAYIEMGVMQPGDEVIVPANTFIASILAITENGLVPVLIEPHRDTLEIDDSLIEQALTPRTKSILLVHLYGRCAYTEMTGTLCRRYHLKLVEDNAQAHGCHYDDRRTGSLGDAAGHSFYPGKNLGTLGDGGAVTTDDDELATVVRSLANYGSVHKYIFQYQGRNSRLDEVQAAVLRVKLAHLDDDNGRRQQIANYYYDHVCNPLIVLPRRLPDIQNVYHIFPVFCSERDCLQEYLTCHGIQTLIHYPVPPHQQACYSAWNTLSLPVTEHIHQTELSIPISPVLTDGDARYIVETLNAFSASDTCYYKSL